MILKMLFLNGFIYKLNTPQFSVFNRSQYGNGRGFKHQSIEDRGKKSFIPSNGFCFIIFTSYLTESDYTEQLLEFFKK